MARLSLIAGSEAELVALAEDVAAVLKPGDLVTLSGDLGMGKSVFARAVIRAIADDDDFEVPSPTYTLAQAYELPRLEIVHADLYRLGGPDDLAELGLRDALARGALLVEWPERAEGMLGPPALAVGLADGPARDARVVILDASADFLPRLTRSLEIRRLLDDAGLRLARRRHLQGDASARGYEAATGQGSVAAVVMNWPRRPPQPVLQDGLSYPELVHVQDDPASFIGVAKALTDRGLTAPKVLAADRDQGLLVLEDLGRGKIAPGGVPDPARYAATARVLAAKDVIDWPADLPLGDGTSWRLPAYDARALIVELSLCPDWYLPLATGAPTSPETRAAFLDLWAPLVDRITTAEQGLVLRDVHSPNVIWREQDTDLADERALVGLIDFQDAMIGPTAYDAMSLATDVRVETTADFRDGVIAAYVAERARLGRPVDGAAFSAAVALTSAQRNTKILGGFARSALRDGKPGYLGHLPRVKALIAEALDHPELHRLKDWYRRHGLITS